MSGGRYDYLCFKIEDMATNLPHLENPKRMAFKKLLALVAAACHEIEWVDSGDSSPGDENVPIDKCLGFLECHPETIAKACAFEFVSDFFEKANAATKAVA